MIALISVTEGEGHGSEVVLEHLLRGWDEPARYFMVAAAENSRIYRVSKELGIKISALFPRDKTLRNILLTRKIMYTFNGCSSVHGWTTKTFELAYYISKKHGIPFTGTLHDHPKSFYFPPRRKFFMRYFANKAARLICVSEALRNACRVSRYRCPMSVIRNGLIDTVSSSGKSEKVRIGFLGMHIPFKGFSILKDWIYALKNENVEWLLYDDVCEELQSESKQLAAAFPDKVLFRGSQTPEKIYGEVDVVLQLSMKFECLPTVLIEAARQGIPAIAADNGGAGEIVEHTKTGFIFNPENPQQGLEYLKAVLSDTGLRKEMGDRARKRYETFFTIDKMVGAYKSIWDSVKSNCSANTIT